MSAYVSIVSSEAAILLTDAAASSRGVLAGIVSKVFAAKPGGLAVTFCGDMELGTAIAGDICAEAEEAGAAHAIGALQSFADHCRSQHHNGDPAVDVLVTAFLPGIGGVHREFRSRPSNIRRLGSAEPVNVPAFTVTEPPRMTSTHAFNADSLDAAGIPLIEPNEPPLLYWYRNGADIMEMLRKQRVSWCGEHEFGIGGRVDLTTITAAGLRTEALRTWPDRIGEKIDPFCTAPTSGMNRKQRRAMAAGK